MLKIYGTNILQAQSSDIHIVALQYILSLRSLVHGLYYRIHFLVDANRVGSITFSQNSHPGSDVCTFSTPTFAESISSTTRFALDCTPNSATWMCGTVNCDEMHVSLDSTILAFDPSLAASGSQYTYTLLTPTLQSSFLVTVNDSPFGGQCVGPSSSPFAFETTSINCMNWMDTEGNYPLIFEFILLLEDDQELILQRSTNPTWRGPLGFGYAPSITSQQADIVVNVYDSKGMSTRFNLSPVNHSLCWTYT